MVSLPAPVLPDVLMPGLRVVFCGYAPGTASAHAGAYYAGPGNRFWSTWYGGGKEHGGGKSGKGGKGER